MKTKNEVRLRVMGAAQSVTGSRHLLETPEGNFLIDCGLFQGLKELSLKNRADFPVEPSSILAVILTHAHLDHCGYLPLLVKNGFRGKIYMTPPTKELAELILLDSAKIQEEEAELANRLQYTRHKPALPLYTTADVEACFPLFTTVEHSASMRLSESTCFEFRKAGHILGAASIVMHCYDKVLVFAGDIGRQQSAMLFPPAPLPAADIVVMESTYGDREHGNVDSLEQLESIVNEAVQTDGNVLIPSFAVGRAQEVMLLLNRLRMERKIPYWLPFFLDSPMAADATDILCRYHRWHRLNHQECVGICKDVVINRSHEGTQRVLYAQGEYHSSKVMIAASGMMTGGRVLEYLRHYVTHENNTILHIGYQAEGTRGRALQEGAKEIKIWGKYYPVEANVINLTGLSAHAGQSELLHWLRQFLSAKPKVFLVHGEVNAQQVLALKIQMELGLDVQIPLENQSITLFKIHQYEPA